MNNVVKNQLYPIKSQYISLDYLFAMNFHNGSINFTKTFIALVKTIRKVNMQHNICWCLALLNITGDENLASQLKLCLQSIKFKF